MSYQPFIPREDFGSVGNLAAALDSVVEYDNIHGMATIFMRVVPPTGGTVAFESTPDGTNWDSATLRSTGADDYQSSAAAADFFLGSISGARKFRVRVSVAGAAAGTVHGSAHLEMSTLEGQEFRASPHKLGGTRIKGAHQFTTAQAGTILYTPSPGKRFCITSLAIAVSGVTDGIVRIFDETDANPNYLANRQFDVSVNAATEAIYRYGEPPWESDVAGNRLRLTSTTNMTISIVYLGYEK